MAKKVSTKKADKKEKVIIPEKRKYLECNFCRAKDYEQHHKESGSSWCKTCGRCFPAIWKIEE
jgi:hypothetical protein